MSYSSLQIEVENWESFINEQGGIGVFGSTDFLISTAKIYGLNIDIRLILLNNKPVLALPLFVKKNSIVLPNHYFYQFIWQKETSKESWSQVEAFDFLLYMLKKKYKKIKVRLPTSIIDVRPFMWNGFNTNLKYTYEKVTSDLRYHQNINRIVNKRQNGYSFDKNCDWERNWIFHYNDLQKFGIRIVNIEIFITYFKKLTEKGLIQVFNAYKDGLFLTSIISIIDKDCKSAYFPLIGTADEHYKNGLPSLLYNYALLELKKVEVEKVDFFGANIQSISKFKSKFLPDLCPYYEVSYSENYQKWNAFVRKFKTYMGKVLYSIRIS